MPSIRNIIIITGDERAVARVALHPHELVNAETPAAAHRQTLPTRQTTILRRSLQPELTDELHSLLRRLHERHQRRAHAENLCAVRDDPRHPRIQRQGLRVHPIRHERICDARHRKRAQHGDKRPDRQVFLGEGERRDHHRCRRGNRRKHDRAGRPGAAVFVRIRQHELLVSAGIRRAGLLSVSAVSVSGGGRSAILRDAAAGAVGGTDGATAQFAGDVRCHAEVSDAVRYRTFLEMHVACFRRR